MSSLWQDVRFGARMLAKQPGVTIIAVLTLALGICANSTIFSWINATMLDPVPGVRGTASLVTVMRGDRNDSPVPPLSYLDYRDLRDGLRGGVFTDVLAYHDDWLAITDSGKPERHYGALVSANYFRLIGAPPALGRVFGEAEERAQPGGAPVVVISDGLWHGRYGGAANVVGRTIQVNRRPYTIIGVAPRGFVGCKTGMHTELWISLAMDEQVWGSQRMSRRDTSFLNIVARLAPGVSRQQATAAAEVVMRRIVSQYPAEHQGPNQISLDPMWRSPFGANVYLYSTLPFLLGIAGVVLLLACANVANLMLVRSVGRRREMAIRLAMGSSRWRLVRQSLIESLLLALAGAGAAVVGTAWTSELFQSFIPPTGNPIEINGRLDATVILATVAIAVASSVGAGILPALRSTRLAPVEVLNEETGRVSGGVHRGMLTRGLVVAQVALSLLLLVFAGLFVRSLGNAERADPGFNADHVLLAAFDLDAAGYDAKTGTQFQRDVLARLRAVPGVSDAAMADWVPLTFSKHTQSIEVEGYAPRRDELMELRRALVSPGYLQTLQIPLVAGREFSLLDTRESEQVLMVDETFAARYWPGQEALGKHVRVGGTLRTVVGVARSTKHHRMNEAPEPMFYVPAFQDYRTALVIHARVAGDAAASASAIRAVVQGLNPSLPVFDVDTFRSRIRMATIFERIGGTFVGAFGLVALLLSAVGIYGVLSYTARQRTRELGIRMALGAGRGEVFRLVVGDGVRLSALGMAIGLAAAVALSGVLRQRLFGIAELDAPTYAAVVALLSAVAFAACAIPAWRASRAQPLESLRKD